ncbi:MAG: DUF445 family protein [Paludibacteraceae bacterium]|nr:DUF445 family protein [Candidatus Physcocola equi]MCQ2233627.1 DUF445 family protein [Paludibacteraceae bacterium]
MNLPTILPYAAPLIIGGVIGYITNKVAIKMLFRPLKPHYIFGFKLPFTPGMIPKERARIAKEFGKSISINLMNKETIEKTLLSEEMIGRIENSIQEFFDKQKANGESLRTLLCHYVKDEQIESLSKTAREALTTQIHKKLTESQLGDKIAKMAVEHVASKIKGSQIGGVFNMFGNVIDIIIDALTNSVQDILKKHINEIINENGDDIVNEMLGNETDKILNTPVKELLNGKEETITEVSNGIINAYKIIVNEQLPKMLGAINIERMIEEKINEMDLQEVEKMILDVAAKELRYIEWFGALLGFLMGGINVLITLLC